MTTNETQSEKIDELAKALIAAQSQLQPAKKDSVNPHFRSGYASLQSVFDAARPALAPQGLAVSQGFTNGTNGETVTVTTTLLHSSGQWMRSALTMKPSKADPQGIGSAITYARRYSLAAILGIVVDEDDDGNAASQKPATTARQAPKQDAPTGTPAEQLKALALRPDLQKKVTSLLSSWGMASISDVTGDDIAVAIEYLLKP